MKGKKLILVVEDRALKEVVGALSVPVERVVTANSICDAEKLIRDKFDDISGVVLDVRLPLTSSADAYNEEGGFRLFELLQAVAKDKGRMPRVIFVTALDSPYVFRYAMDRHVPIFTKDMLGGLKKWALRLE